MGASHSHRKGGDSEKGAGVSRLYHYVSDSDVVELRLMLSDLTGHDLWLSGNERFVVNPNVELVAGEVLAEVNDKFEVVAAVTDEDR